MNHTPQIKKAIQFAAKKHNGHMRKETEPLPYITHLFSVALLVAEDGADDDTVSAALLHDTVEDTETTREEIATEFNERVAELVTAVSEPSRLPWKERKTHYLAQLEKADDEALLIAIADKIDNIESKLAALEKEGSSLFDRWSQEPEAYTWFHGEALRIAKTRLPEHRLTKRLAEACAQEQEAVKNHTS